jgi:hypothetical protein
MLVVASNPGQENTILGKTLWNRYCSDLTGYPAGTGNRTEFAGLQQWNFIWL